MTDTLDTVEITPPTLKQRVAEAVEYERKIKLHRDSTNLERLLLQAKIVTTKLPAPQIKVDKQGRVRFDLDDVAFTIISIVNPEYDDDGETIGEKEHVRLSANLICTRDECTRVRYYPRVDMITKLSDLDALYDPKDNWRKDDKQECGLGDRHGQEHSLETDGYEDDDLSDLPF